MSLAIKQSRVRAGMSPTAGAMISRRAYMGDPGLFGFLGDAVKTIGGFLPGPVGIAAKAVGGLLNGGGSTATTGQVWKGQIMNTTAPFAPAPQQSPSYGAGVTINPPFAGPPGMGIATHFGPTTNGGGGAVQSMNGKAPSGYHFNKTDYFLKNGTFVPKGSRLVKNRRRNPLNPRAASRAISRLESAKKAVSRLDRVAIKCKRCGCARCKC